MNRKVGIWLDQRTAHIIWVGMERIIKIDSNIRARTHYSGGIRIGGTYNQGRDSELRHNDKYQHQLHRYFEKVLSSIKNADSIYIFGPGEARIELEHEIKKEKAMSSRVVHNEPSDNLTEAQMRAQVREFFTEQDPASKIR